MNQAQENLRKKILVLVSDAAVVDGLFTNEIREVFVSVFGESECPTCSYNEQYRDDPREKR